MFKLKRFREYSDYGPNAGKTTFTIEFRYGGVIISLSPGDTVIENIKNTDIETKKGFLNENPKNGEFSLDWDESMMRIDICCGTYNDTKGGNVFISVPYTAETIASLRSCLREIKFE